MDQNGDFRVEMKIEECEWLYNYIISFGEYITIEEPKYINSIIKNKLIKILSCYT